MTSSTISLGILDDHPIFRAALASYLESTSLIKTRIQSCHADNLFQLLNDVTIDILLLDIYTPGDDVKTTISFLRNRYAGIKLLLLTRCTDLDFISELVDLGIHGYITKGAEPEELVQAIKAISEGRIHQNKDFTQALYWNRQNNINGVAQHETNGDLSDREKSVLKLLWEEMTNKEIAEQIFLSVRSVEKIRQDLKDRLHIKSTVGLIKYALKSKIILSPELSGRHG